MTAGAARSRGACGDGGAPGSDGAAMCGGAHGSVHSSDEESVDSNCQPFTGLLTSRFYLTQMRVLALDTTTRAGSVALVEDDRIVDERAGDATRTHTSRLPGELLACSARPG